MRKNFVLDTNILLHSPEAMVTAFEDNNVILTGTTLQELDAKKTADGEVGYNARESCRILDRLREKGDLRKGVELENGGKLYVVTLGWGYGNKTADGASFLPFGYPMSSADNRIIATCRALSGKESLNSVQGIYQVVGGPDDGPVILVTEDISLRINASICGVQVETFRNCEVEDSGYTGHCVLETGCPEMVDCIYKNGCINIEKDHFIENEFVTVKCGSQSALTVYQDHMLRAVKPQTVFGHVKPLNSMQTYAMWALLQPASEVPLVLLLGPAGTAKTFLSLACGIDQVYAGNYSRVMISRPTARSYERIGFLKGGLEEKLKPLLDSYYDNMSILLSGGGKENKEQADIHMDDLLESGTVEVCGLDFIRGRSLQDTYLICDEAQNASAGLIRDVVTRAGRGTKVVLAGDPDQIDVPSLSKRSNGLVYALEAMKESSLSAVCVFGQGQSVRSDLSKECIKRMKV